MRNDLQECPRCGYSYDSLDRIRNCAESHLAKAGAAMNEADFEAMLRSARRSRSLRKSDRASIAVIIAAAATGRYQEALRECENLISRQPGVAG